MAKKTTYKTFIAQFCDDAERALPAMVATPRDHALVRKLIYAVHTFQTSGLADSDTRVDPQVCYSMLADMKDAYDRLERAGEEPAYVHREFHKLLMAHLERKEAARKAQLDREAAKAARVETTAPRPAPPTKEQRDELNHLLLARHAFNLAADAYINRVIADEAATWVNWGESRKANKWLRKWAKKAGVAVPSYTYDTTKAPTWPVPRPLKGTK